MSQNSKAFLIGILVNAVVSCTALLCMEALKNEYFAWLNWCAPLIGAFVVALMANSMKFLLSTLLFLPAALIYWIENYLFQYIGTGGYYPGYSGYAVEIGGTLLFTLAMCGIGGLFGSLIAFRKLFLIVVAVIFVCVFIVPRIPKTYYGKEINGKIVDSESGEPITNIEVNYILESMKPKSGHGHDYKKIYTFKTVTKEDGRFTIPAWRKKIGLYWYISNTEPTVTLKIKGRNIQKLFNKRTGPFYEGHKTGLIRVVWQQRDCKYNDPENHVICYYDDYEAYEKVNLLWQL